MVSEVNRMRGSQDVIDREKTPYLIIRLGLALLMVVGHLASLTTANLFALLTPFFIKHSECGQC